MENLFYKTGDYKLYVLKEGHTYCFDGQNFFDKLNIPFEEAFALYHNKRTMMLTWQKGDEDFCLHSTMLICQDDKKIFSHSLASYVYNEVANNLLKGISSTRFPT